MNMSHLFGFTLFFFLYNLLCRVIVISTNQNYSTGTPSSSRGVKQTPRLEYPYAIPMCVCVCVMEVSSGWGWRRTGGAVCLPSSRVRTEIGYDDGPSPTDVPASTQILYSVHRFRSSSTSAVPLSTRCGSASESDTPLSAAITL